ncbi:hypothetical protein IWW36_003904 [Coemansia brasiliensis]|uniref:Uncharacterized protein n=1 Tax=Coemansia brasiliensis TaxID=2650707 RepID=A0A9W8LYH9_9FUNG|nr:hypothetical protein IWW36_003904 [Coemansia brasiliensis]
MEAQPKPLLNYAKELLQSYSRLIVYSGDILRSLPEPREGLSLANFKTKKDESTAFLREWQHLESVLDEYLIRLNDIRTRAHEELDAARIRCLAGDDIDLTLPEAVYKLNLRLTKYKQQYDALQTIVNGGSFADITEKMAQEDTAMEVEPTNSPKHTVAETTPSQTQVVDSGPDGNSPDHNTSPATETDTANISMSQPANTMQSQDIKPKQEPESQLGSIIDVDAEDDDELFRGSPNMADDGPIELNSDSDIDDETMKDIFDS